MLPRLNINLLCSQITALLPGKLCAVQAPTCATSTALRGLWYLWYTEKRDVLPMRVGGKQHPKKGKQYAESIKDCYFIDFSQPNKHSAAGGLHEPE